MIDINLEKNREFYTDYEKCLEFLKTIKMDNYEYPNHITNFHVYSEIKTPKELMVVKSYLATQNLEKTKLILWSDYDVSNNELLKPYIDYIDLRIYNPIEEAKGTLLEDKNEYLRAEDNRHWMNSGVLRFLMIHKYGGIWLDMDMILLRDFKPIMDQDFAYMWGSSIDFERRNLDSGDCYGPCAALTGGIKNSEYTNICLEEMIKTPIVPLSCCFDHEMLAKVYRRYKFTVFPSTFFNTEWQINIKYPGASEPIQDGHFKKTETSDKYLFLEAFAWHWHNTSNKNKIVEPGSKFDILTSLIDDKLKEKNII